MKFIKFDKKQAEKIIVDGKDLGFLDISLQKEIPLRTIFTRKYEVEELLSRKEEKVNSISLDELIEKLTSIRNKYGNIKEIQTVYGKDDYIINGVIINQPKDTIYLELKEI